MPINYKDYHPEWKTRIRPDILKRADNKCEFCDIPNYSTNARGTKVILTISHQDHDKKNNDYENLKALCQACHLKYDMDRHVANRKKNQAERKNKNQLKLFGDKKMEDKFCTNDERMFLDEMLEKGELRMNQDGEFYVNFSAGILSQIDFETINLKEIFKNGRD